MKMQRDSIAILGLGGVRSCSKKAAPSAAKLLGAGYLSTCAE